MKKALFLVIILVFAVLPLFVIQPSFASPPAGTITYSGATDTITVVGANSSHPAEFLDLYNADVAGGWNQISKQGDNQFLVNCLIIIGNGTSAGTTYFVDYAKQVVLAAGVITSTSQSWFSCTAYSYVTFGVLISGKNTKQGVDFVSREVTNFHNFINGGSGTVYLYSCTFQAATVTHFVDYVKRMYNCKFGQRFAPITREADIYDCILDAGHYLQVGAGASAPTVDKVSVFAPTGAYYVRCGSTGNNTLSNVYGRGSATNAVYVSSTGSTFLVNPDFDVWGFYFGAAGTVYRQVTFNLYVLNGALTDFVENANVTLTHDGTVYGSWLANSTGQIPTQTLTYGFYNQTGGNTMYGGTAWTLTISHPDWQTYTSTFYPYSKIEWSISMQDTSTTNNNLLLSGLFVGVLCFAGFIVYSRRN